MKCPVCGSILPNYCSFCSVCGAPLEEAASGPGAAAAQTEGAPPDPLLPADRAARQSRDAGARSRKSQTPPSAGPPPDPLQ